MLNGMSETTVDNINIAVPGLRPRGTMDSGNHGLWRERNEEIENILNANEERVLQEP